MSGFILLNNWNTLYIATNPLVPAQQPGVNPWAGTLATAPPPLQTFELLINGTAGNVSGTAQIIVSNSGNTWYKYGDPMSATSAYLNASTALSGNQGWNLYGAILTAISGTNATATLTMEC